MSDVPARLTYLSARARNLPSQFRRPRRVTFLGLSPMQRKPSAADERPESPAELIARITAERQANAEPTGRHGAVAVLPARTRRRARDDDSDPAPTGRHGTPEPAGPDPVDDLDRAPSGSVGPMTAPSLTARRRRRGPVADTATIVTRDVAVSSRSRARRLAPLAVGAVVILLATVVATTVRPDPGPEPELSSALVDEPAVQVAPDEGSGATVPPTVESRAPESVGAVTPGEGALVVDDVTWTPAGGDDFTDGLSPDWTVYDQDGRSPDAVSVADGVLTLRGDEAGRTGGVAWTEGSRFGRWEMRARFPAGDPRYHPVLLLWPTDVEWPGGGEIDFAETASSSGTVAFFLHHGADNSQLYAERTLDTTQWHDYAVEWTENRVTGYVDGQKWFESTDPNTLPPGNMQAVVQLDWFADADPATGPAAPSEMQVDHVRLYT